MSAASASPLLRLYRRLAAVPLGRALFTRLVCFKAPYFSSISPLFLELANGRARVRVRKRRKVHNHIGTVHAIAMVNACELAAGTMMEASVPRSLRWIPRGMTVEYVRKATTDIVALATLDAEILPGPARDVDVRVEVMDTHGETLLIGHIAMYVSPRK